ncbi:hypothetical protein ACPW96_23105 [Micromonospora sp. DT81.3]|uniref:hypothetical protein n=1 Tax=Micromonospora sp. DT81.3 TaxID=3416523 RepID=UPI003CE7DF47
MTNAETPDQIAARIIRETRAVASSLPFDERANLLREVTKAVRDAVKFDATLGGAPKGAEWEKDGLASVGNAAEEYYFAALKEKQSRQE